MRIEKVINNNIISARDDKGVELVVMGRGIGFDKKPGNEIRRYSGWIRWTTESILKNCLPHCLLNI